MPRYRLSFIGRKRGEVGPYYRLDLEITAKSAPKAIEWALTLYRPFANEISISKIKEVEDEHEPQADR